MKTLWKIVGGILVCLVLALLVLRVTGLEPHERIPGLWLKGDLVTTPVDDWSFTDKIPDDQGPDPHVVYDSTFSNNLLYCL